VSKLLAGIIAALIVGVGVAAASSLTTSNDDPVPTSSISTLDSTASTSTTESTGTTETTPTTSTQTGEDISGPCDEAEHANDPRCTGGATTQDDDRRGRGRDEDDRADDHGGRGRDHAEDDGGADDHSGRGHSGGDEDRSGSNSGDDD
jgi:hypothetical protein